MGRCDTPRESIENLLGVKLLHFPEQPIHWEYLLLEFLSSSNFPFDGAPFQFLVMCEPLAFIVWRDYITKMIHTATFDYSSATWLFA